MYEQAVCAICRFRVPLTAYLLKEGGSRAGFHVGRPRGRSWFDENAVAVLKGLFLSCVIILEKAKNNGLQNQEAFFEPEPNTLEVVLRLW